MSYWIQEKSPENRNSYMCDKRTDIESLPKFEEDGKEIKDDTVSSKPCLYGSICLCLEDSSTWVLGKDENTWKEL